MDEFSVRTEYREKRIRIIKEMLWILLDMLLLPRKSLEKIPYVFMKNIKNSLRNQLDQVKPFERYMHDTHISPNELDAIVKT
jgi:hypothetical protein